VEIGGYRTKFKVLKQQIADTGSLLVAFSGGTDSAFLAATARDVLGTHTRCMFLDSPMVSRSALIDIRRIGTELGLAVEIHKETALDETVVKNPVDRCYHCKKHDARVLKHQALALGLAHVADGVHLSDLDEYRPGIAAATEEGILHPFVAAGITKDDIRNLAREQGYWFWNKPAAACLSSRIPYGEEISVERLAMIEAAEEHLHFLGFVQARVRMHSGIARIEVAPEKIPEASAHHREICDEFRKIGIHYITLDLEGYRTGSMDELLRGPSAKKLAASMRETREGR
jgi:uncharacterized protein